MHGKLAFSANRSGLDKTTGCSKLVKSIITFNYRLFSKPRFSHVSQILNLCKSGSFFQALQLLNTIDSSNISSNVKPFVYASLLQLLNTIDSSNISSNVKPFVYASLLQTATKVQTFNHGIQLHSFIVKSGLIANPLVGNSLLSFYFKLSISLSSATKLFDESSFTKDVISWTNIISGYVRVKPELSLSYFWTMLNSGIKVDGFTLSAGIKACSEIGDVKLGRCFHGVVYRNGFELNHVIGSALIDMYGKSSWLKYAGNVFVMSEPDDICWSSIISAFTRNDSYEEALAYFYLMLRECEIVPDEYTYGSVLTACGNLERLKQGKQVHARVVTSGLCGNVVAESSLVDMYGKCGQVRDSQRVFDTMRKRNAVSWGTLLNGYCQNGLFDSVIKLFRMMEDPDLYSFGTLIRACAGLVAVRLGKEVHCQYVRKVVKGHVIIESALIDLYAKCGCIEYAYRLFTRMPSRNLISWNSMISGFAQNGRGLEAIELFNKMTKEGVRPDYISFLSVIFACSHAGFVDKGREYFISMTKEYGIEPGIEHCNCMVDLLGRAGLINEAESLIKNAECKDSFSLWSTLLGACTHRRDSAAVERIALKMIELKPKNHLGYVNLINVYKSDGRWNDASKIWKLMEDRGAEKLPGKSWVENASCFISNKISTIGGRDVSLTSIL